MFALCASLAILMLRHPPLENQVADLSSRLLAAPDSVELLTLRGTVYFQSRDFDHALADFEHALSSNPTNPQLLRHKAATLNAAGLPHAALAVLNGLLADAPDSADAHLLRARVLRTLDQPSAAANDFEAVLKLAKPPRPEIFLELADVYAETHNLTARAATLARGCETLGPLPHLLEPRARTLIALHDFDTARAAIMQLAQASPASFTPALLSAECTEAMGDIPSALSQFKSLVRTIDQSSPHQQQNDIAREARAYAAQAALRLAAQLEHIP